MKTASRWDLRTACLTLGFQLLASATAGQQTASKPQAVPARPAEAKPAQISGVLPIERRQWTGDLDGMIKRRLIRVLVPHSKTHYFVERGQQRGIAYEALTAFEDQLKKSRGALKVHVVFFPTMREQLIPDLVAGLGDIAVGGLTITPEREKLVDFSLPSTTKPISEVVVTGPQSPQVATLDDLAGKEVFVRKSSSHWEHLSRVNERFAKEGKAAVVLRPAPEDLEDEDLLEMLNAGLCGVGVVDDYSSTSGRRFFRRFRAMRTSY